MFLIHFITRFFQIIESATLSGMDYGTTALADVYTSLG